MRRANGRTLEIFSSLQQKLGTNVDVFVGDFLDFFDGNRCSAAFHDGLTVAVYVQECVESVLSNDELRALAAHELNHSINCKNKWGIIGRHLRPVIWWFRRREMQGIWKAYAKEEAPAQRAGVQETGYDTYVSMGTKAMHCLMMEQINRLSQA